MSYHQFTSEERFCLWELLEKGHSIRAISRAIGRAPSSVSRELKRNRSKKGNYHHTPEAVLAACCHSREMDFGER